MKEQLKSVILPALPIVGKLKLTSRDGKSLYSIEVVDELESKEIDPFFKSCYEEIESFLKGEKKEINIKLDFTSVMPFQLEVLEAMKKIPYGQTATYKDLALKMKSKAYQAIGSACGRNPFLLIYPCHRVIGTKDMGGFAHGLSMKMKLLRLEA